MAKRSPELERRRVGWREREVFRRGLCRALFEISLAVRGGLYSRYVEDTDLYRQLRAIKADPTLPFDGPAFFREAVHDVLRHIAKHDDNRELAAYLLADWRELVGNLEKARHYEAGATSRETMFWARHRQESLREAQRLTGCHKFFISRAV